MWGQSRTLTRLLQYRREATLDDCASLRGGRLADCLAMPGGPVQTRLAAVPAAVCRVHVPVPCSSAKEDTGNFRGLFKEEHRKWARCFFRSK